MKLSRCIMTVSVRWSHIYSHSSYLTDPPHFLWHCVKFCHMFHFLRNYQIWIFVSFIPQPLCVRDIMLGCLLICPSVFLWVSLLTVPDSKVHEANMRPIRGWQDPGGPHVDPMNLVICGVKMGSCQRWWISHMATDQLWLHCTQSSKQYWPDMSMVLFG